MRPLLAAILLLVPAQARTVSLSWDAAPVGEQVVGWRVYRSAVLISASNVPSAAVTLDNNLAVLTVTAINVKGESPPSAPVTILPPLRWIQASNDTVSWRNVVQVSHQPEIVIRLLPPPPETPDAPVWIQQSVAADIWQNVVEIPYTPRQFIRLQLPPP